MVVVNARERVSPLYAPAEAAALNADLAAEAARWDHVVLADWATASARLPDSWFATDRLHFGEDPAAPATLPAAGVWVDTVTAAVGRCPTPTRTL